MAKRGSVIFNEKTKKFRIDWRTTHSYIVAMLQLEAILSASRYAKGKLLDIGCGNKPFLYIFKDKIKSYIGIDMPYSLHINTDIDVFSSGDNIPFKDGSFNTTLTTSVLEHVRHPQKMFDEMYRVLKNDSYLILTTPFQYGLHEQPYDYFRYTKYSLRFMAEKSGFKVIYIKPIGGMLVIISQLIAKYIAILLYVLLEKLKGNKIDRTAGFQRLKKNSLIQFISFIPQIFFLILYKLGFKKIDDLSAEVDPCLYVMVAKK